MWAKSIQNEHLVSFTSLIISSKSPNCECLPVVSGDNCTDHFFFLIAFKPALIPENTLSIHLENLTWVEAEKALKHFEVALIALGARTKEHGPHLLLKNDYIMAEYLKDRVIQEVSVAVLPTLQYGYYPAFLEYPGSVSLRAETFKNVVMDICRSMNGYGLKKIYILNTGVSTLRPLKAAQEELESEGIVLRFTNILEIDKKLVNISC